MRSLVQFLVLASVLVKVFCLPCPFCSSCADPKPKISTCYLRDPWRCPYAPSDPVYPSDPDYISLPGLIRPKPKPKVKICCSTDPNSGYLDPYGRYISKPKVSVCCTADPASPCGGPVSLTSPVVSDPSDPAGNPVRLCSCCLYPDGASCPQCFSIYQHQ